EQMRAAMLTIMTGKATDAQIAGFLVALRCKGESVAEITAAVEVMRELATPVRVTGEHLIDTCGTGGDGANTFNISTTSAFVVAAAGGRVAKHGNRSVSSRCGSADVLEAAGVNLNLNADQVAECVNTLNIGFLFAPKYHGAMQYTRAARSEMGVRTLLNLLGPLSNPARAPNQLIGVYAPQWLEPMAQVLNNLGSRHVLLVCSEDGLDEISIATATRVTELKEGSISSYTISPEQFGLERGELAGLAVNDVNHSLTMLKSVLDNQPGAAKNIVLLNAGAAIYAANLAETLNAGIAKAEAVIADGSARGKLDSLIAYTRQLETLPT
ncbi:MAG: anthranilate phosphoribosyltransferase, partial [Methylobacter sp.]